LAQGTLDQRDLIDEINKLLEVKMRAGESATSPRWEAIHAFILREVELAEANSPPAVERPSAAELDELLRNCVLNLNNR
jgi:predicted nucleotidyltransferase